MEPAWPRGRSCQALVRWRGVHSPKLRHSAWPWASEAVWTAHELCLGQSPSVLTQVCTTYALSSPQTVPSESQCVPHRPGRQLWSASHWVTYKVRMPTLPRDTGCGCRKGERGARELTDDRSEPLPSKPKAITCWQLRTFRHKSKHTHSHGEISDNKLGSKSSS